MSRLSKLFRPSPRPVTRKARLGVEALDARELPSVTFLENPTAHSLTVTAGNHQDNRITIRNNGNGNLFILADSVARNFTHVTSLTVKTGDGEDSVDYKQGDFAHAADIHRSFSLKVDLGGQFDSNHKDFFSADVFGNVGFYDGTMHAKNLSFEVNGGAAADEIAFHFHDTDLRRGSILTVKAEGSGGDDDISMDYDGKNESASQLRVTMHAGGIFAGVDEDTVNVSILLDTGSGGTVAGDGPSGAAIITGDLGDDLLTFAITQESGSHARVNAMIDGGFNLYDHDIGNHTSNVQTTGLEQTFSLD